MESIATLKIDERTAALDLWISSICRINAFSLQLMQGDASFRRYFRVFTKDVTYVAMDAPPPNENCRPFVAIANALRTMGLRAPQIVHADLERGFLLLTDFGDTTYLSTLTAQNANTLYQRALDALAQLQACKHVEGHHVPLFTRDFMQKEWAWHKEWFLQKLLGLTLPTALERELDASMTSIVESAAQQPQVFMHRDYHSANLMLLANGDVGILDFQDAFIGPVTYDLVSLLRDCYIDWDKQLVRQWALSYLERLHVNGVLKQVDQEVFLRWFDWMGMQRHLKALLTFGRKHVRDHQSQYLLHVPRTLNYLLDISADYPELTQWYDYLHETVQPAFFTMRDALCEQ